MKTQKFTSLGLGINLQVPETVEEFDQNAKKTGACLAEAINNVVYRGSLAEFRNVFLHGREADETNGVTAIKGLDDLTGIERTTKPVLDKNGKPTMRDGKEVTSYDETEKEYFDRVCATQSVEVEAFRTLADEVASAIAFDASATERKAPQPKKLAEIYKNSAKAVVGNIDKNWPKLEAMFAKTGTALPVLGDDVEKNIDLVGWALKAHKDAEAKQSLGAFEA